MFTSWASTTCLLIVSQKGNIFLFYGLSKAYKNFGNSKLETVDTADTWFKE